MIHDLTNTILLAYMLIISVAILRTGKLIIAVLLCSAFSLLMALIYTNMGAPDVAITEAAVGAGVSTVFFLNALSIVGLRTKKTNEHSITALLVIAATAASMMAMIKQLPEFGNPDNPVHNHISRHYIEITNEKFKIPNVVTAILASMRGYDTMCETTVVMTAATCVLLILGGKDEEKEKSE